MALTYRLAKGSPLTNTEGDANFAWCAPTSGSTQQNLDLKGSLDANNTWTKAQRGAFFELTSTSASIAINLERSNNFNHTLTEDTTLAAPTNVVAGQSGIIHFTQHASAAKTLAYNAFWKFAGGTVPTLTATNGAIDVLSYVVNPGGASATCALIKDVK
jgi:hypothetical protein